MADKKAIVTKVRVYKINIPLKQPFVISLGPIHASQNIAIQIETDIGLIGIGECSPFPTIMGETQDTCFAMAQLFSKLLIGKDALDLEDCFTRIESAVAFNYTIKSAFDMALYDLSAKFAALPLYEFLGGKQVERMETDITVTLADATYMAAEALRYQKMGFPVLKVKLGENGKKDIERIAAIRSAIGSKLPLRIDANQGWSTQEAIDTLKELSAFNIQHCEAPVRRWNRDGLKKVHDQSPIPIMADESLFDHHDAQMLVDLNACDLFNIKFAKSGGIFNALKILEIAEQNNIASQVGSMGESRLAITALAHLAATRPSIKYYDLDFPLLHAEDPVRGGLRYNEDWSVSLSEEIGIGATYDTGFLDQSESISIQ